MKEYYLKKADENLLPLKKKEIKPRIEPVTLDKGDSIVVDLGSHYVGYFSFNMEPYDVYIDAPVRMALRFCEVERELGYDNTVYSGWLCQSWLQEEIINVDFPGVYRMPRRYAARYVKIDILYTPKKLVLSDFTFTAESAVLTDEVPRINTSDSELIEIDRVAVNTLRNCMQRVFEDGPKRDRRLWIGDLRLEALANYYTFGNSSLVKRCLYLFAASERNEHGFMPGYVYENPRYVSGYWFLTDYSLLYVCSLADYYLYTGDEVTFGELYSVAKSILDSVAAAIDSDELVTSPAGDEDIFIDWCEGLEKKTALEGVYLYTLDIWSEALRKAGLAHELEKCERMLADGRRSARKELYNEEKKAFINKRDKGQYSVHSTAWMILAGVVEGEEAREALTLCLNSEDSLKPFTPYMHHYTAEAMFVCGMREEAEKYIRRIWGGMVKDGADTFAEAYTPGDPSFSPYGDAKVNSMCHAWSCTPTYFIRKYGL